MVGFDFSISEKGQKSNQSSLAFFGEENLNKITKLCRKNSQKLGY